MKTLGKFREACVRNCINFRQASLYKHRHGLTEEETIRQLREKNGYSEDKVFTLVEYCEAAELDVNEVIEYIDTVNDDTIDLADFVVSFILFGGEMNITDICESLKISVARFKGIKRRNRDLDDCEIIKMCLTTEHREQASYNIKINGTNYSLKGACRALGISYNYLLKLKANSNESIEELLLSRSDKVYRNMFGEIVAEGIAIETKVKQERAVDKNTFKHKCLEHKINYKTAVNYRRKHTELSDEQVLSRYRE